MISVRVPQLTPPGPNVREHWGARQRRVKKERRDVALALSQHKPPKLPVLVTLTRMAPRLLDDDNAVGAAKSARDEVAAWLGLVTDADPRAVWRVWQRKALRKEAGTLIQIESITDAEALERSDPPW